jgi:50S ribosomal protein L16 3-hydroxylase
LRFFNRLNMNPDTPLQLLGGISAREFLRDYWQKKPLLVRQAFPDFISPIDADELAGLALEEEVESRLVLEHGERPWELRRGPFAEDTFSELPERLDPAGTGRGPVRPGSGRTAGKLPLPAELAYR